MLKQKPPVYFPLTKLLIVDIESRGLDAKYDPHVPVYMVGIGAVNAEGEGSYEQYTIEDAVYRIDLLLNNGYVVLMHNAAFDYSVLKTHGLQWQIKPGELSIVCTMAMAFGWNSSRKSYSLEALTGEKEDIVQLVAYGILAIVFRLQPIFGRQIGQTTSLCSMS